MLQVQYPGEFPVCSRLNHCDRFSLYCASLAEERRNKEDVRLGHASTVCRLAGLVLQRSFLAALTVLLLMKTLEMS